VAVTIGGFSGLIRPLVVGTRWLNARPGASKHCPVLRSIAKAGVSGRETALSRVKKPADDRMRSLRASSVAAASATAPRNGVPSPNRQLEDVESVARIGSYSTDLMAGRWVSSKGLDAIFGIDGGFERSVEGWASLVHPAEREAMVAYLTDEVIGSGQPFDKQYRIVRADTGEERWVHGRGKLNFDASGRPLRMFGTIADITEQRTAQDALIASELRYAAIFEGTAESILIADLATRHFRWVNSAACALLGYTRGELLELTVHDIHPPADLPMVLDRFQAIADGRITMARSVSCQRKDGTILLADISASQAVVEGVACNIGFFTDVTERVAAEEEAERLEKSLRGSQRNLAEAQRIAHIGSWEWDLAADTAWRSEELHRIYGVEPGTVAGTTEAFLAFVHPDDRARVQASERAAISGGGQYGLEYRAVRPDGSIRIIHDEAQVVRDPSGAPVRMIGTAQDVTERVAAEEERTRLATAVEQTSDSVVTTDLAGTIEYVNPAFELVSGYRREEVIGQNPRILQSGRQSAAFYRALWRRLTRGQTWTGTLINRRKDGSLYEEDATISPIRGPGGEVTGYVAVQRDVTALRAAESGLAREFRERAEVAAALARLQPGPSAEATAALICDELLGLPGIDLVAIFTFLDPEHAFVLASAGPANEPLVPGRPLPVARARYLYERAAQGPWAEAWRTRPEDGQYGRQIAALGLRASAFAPIRNGDGLLGVVAVGTRDEAYVRHLIDHLPAVGEFAATARALLSGQLERGQRDELVRERVRRALAEGGLSPVFQPIVALASGTPIGYEALTRFTDGTPPDRLIAEARSAGLGPELEVACLAAALDASETLAPDCWLSLNASPDVILHSTELAGLLRGRSRQIVIEVTEHAEIDDYAAVRHAVAALGPTVSLAVDDAGAGFASLRHIVELVPRFLKLDISLVRHVDRDLTRQAMIAGLSHFAARAGCQVIAEGIEDPAELEMLRELGVPFGQGYLLGRPEPLPTASGSAMRPGPATNVRRSPGERTGASGPRSRRRWLASGPPRPAGANDREPIRPVRL
jgi:PAS domain S-box-containing protein